MNLSIFFLLNSFQAGMSLRFDTQFFMDNYSQRLNNVIPGGAHTYSRGDDQFPSNAPSILARGEGAYVWNPEGKKFLDYGMGLRSVNIGYGNEEVADAVYKEILDGNNLTRASLTELKAAELLSTIIPSAEMVKFAKHGSTVTTAAVKLARAFTGRKYIAVPIEQPFFSFDDWFIGSTVLQKGVLLDASQYTKRFNYKDLNSLNHLFESYPGQIAAIMMEAATTMNPCLCSCDSVLENCNSCPSNGENFLKKAQELAHKNGSLFILDEMITGFRWDFQGAQKFYGITPDLSTFGKAMANGFAVAALTGKREIMSLGNIKEEGHERVFLTSTTHGAEMGSLGAFIKTMEILQRDQVIAHFWDYGKKLKIGMNQIAEEIGINSYFYVEGYSCSLNYVTKDRKGQISLEFRTLFAQELIKNGVMMPYIALCQSHGEKELEITLNAVNKSLRVYKKALDEGVEKYLHGPSIKPVFRKFN
jgi:glutamate-1-semialdehyde 2,1-aminomutase